MICIGPKIIILFSFIMYHVIIIFVVVTIVDAVVEETIHIMYYNIIITTSSSTNYCALKNDNCYPLAIGSCYTTYTIVYGLWCYILTYLIQQYITYIPKLHMYNYILTDTEN